MRLSPVHLGMRLLVASGLLFGITAFPSGPLQAASDTPAKLAGTGPTLTSTFVSTAPTIDGVITTAEWGAPLLVTFNGTNSPSRLRAGELSIVNTATDLYIALAVADNTPSDLDILELDFDTPHTHSPVAGLEDALRYLGWHLTDLYWGDNWTPDVHQHGKAAMKWLDGKYRYEFSKPLYSGDGHDMAVTLGGSLGFRIQTWDSDPLDTDFFRYPVDSRGSAVVAEWLKWSDLTIAKAIVTDPPSPTAPANASQLSAMTTTLNWTNPPSTTQVHLQVVPANNDGPGLNLILGNATSFNIPAPPNWYGLLPDMSYSWRVRATAKPTSAAETDSSWGPWSQNRTFRTPIRDSSRFSAASPVSGSAVVSDTQILEWRNEDTDVFYYEVQVSPDPNFGEQGAIASVWNNLVHGGISNTPNSWTTPLLQPKTTYYWHVRPRVQGDGTSPAWSATWTFFTR